MVSLLEGEERKKKEERKKVRRSAILDRRDRVEFIRERSEREQKKNKNNNNNNNDIRRKTGWVYGAGCVQGKNSWVGGSGGEKKPVSPHYCVIRDDDER